MCNSGNCLYEELLSGDCTLDRCILIKEIDKQLMESDFNLEYEEPRKPMF